MPGVFKVHLIVAEVAEVLFIAVIVGAVIVQDGGGVAQIGGIVNVFTVLDGPWPPALNAEIHQL